MMALGAPATAAHPTPLRAAARDLAGGSALALLLTLAVVAGTLVVPLYDMQVLDRVLVSRSLDTLAVLALASLVGLVVYAVAAALRAAVLDVAAERATRRLSHAAIEAGLRRAIGGDALSGGRAIADVQALRGFLGGGAAAAPFDLLAAPLLLGTLFLLHPGLGWFGLAAALAMLAVTLGTDAATRPRLAAAQQRVERAAHETAGLLGDRSLAEGLGMAPAIAARFRTRHGAALAALDAALLRGEAGSAAARLLRAALQAGVIAYAAMLVLRDQATPGIVVGANLLLAMLLAPLDALVAHWRALSGARLAWQRLGGLLAMPEAAAPPDPPPDSRVEGLALDAVTCHPPGAIQAVFAGLSLRVAPGEMVVLTGPNGAGKSSLARLAAGVLAPESGRVTVAGQGAVAAARAGRIGFVPQRVQVIPGSIAEIIARFSPATPDAVVAAARAAGLHETVGRLPEGYATRLGPFDPVLSGGERQRLALASALFGDPPVLVVDEADSALDQAGEAILGAALTAARARGAAVLAVTHRRSLLAQADRVLCIEDGTLREMTAHAG
jgi:ATP-binding cassette subfamily C protein